jgi:hypothetical protein
MAAPKVLEPGPAIALRCMWESLLHMLGFATDVVENWIPHRSLVRVYRVERRA